MVGLENPVFIKLKWVHPAAAAESFKSQAQNLEQAIATFNVLSL